MQLIINRENPSSSAQGNQKTPIRIPSQTGSKKTKICHPTATSPDQIGMMKEHHDCLDKFYVTGDGCKEPGCINRKKAIMAEADKLLEDQGPECGERSLAFVWSDLMMVSFRLACGERRSQNLAL